MRAYLLDMLIVLGGAALLIPVAMALGAFHGWLVSRRDPVLAYLRSRVARGGAVSWNPTNNDGPDRVAARGTVTPTTLEKRA